MRATQRTALTARIQGVVGSESSGFGALDPTAPPLKYNPPRFNLHASYKELATVCAFLKLPSYVRTDDQMMFVVDSMVGCDLIESLDKETARDLVKSSVLKQVEQGEVIFHRLSPPEYLAIVLSGTVGLCVVTKAANSGFPSAEQRVHLINQVVEQAQNNGDSKHNAEYDEDKNSPRGEEKQTLLNANRLEEKDNSSDVDLASDEEEGDDEDEDDDPPPPPPPPPVAPSPTDGIGSHGEAQEGFSIVVDSPSAMENNQIEIEMSTAQPAPATPTAQQQQQQPGQSGEAPKQATVSVEVAFLGPGSVLGERSVSEAELRNSFFIAKTSCALMLIDRVSYFKIVQKVREQDTTNMKLMRAVYMPRNAYMLTKPDRFYKASMIIRAATHGISPRAFLLGPLTRKIDQLVTGQWVDSVIAVLCLGQMALIFFEPPSYVDADLPYYRDILPTLIAVELAFVGCYLIGLLFIMRDLGVARFFRGKTRVLQFIILLLFAVDLFTAAVLTSSEGQPLRFSRILRPILLGLHVTSIRRMYQIAFSLLPRLMEVFFLGAAIFIFYASVGMFFFNQDRSVYDKQSWENSMFAPCRDVLERNTSVPIGCPAVVESVFSSFSSYTDTFISLFALITTETYPDIAMPAHGRTAWYLIYFITFLALGYFFLLNVIIAVLHGHYRRTNQKYLMRDLRREQVALATAFRCMDLWDCGILPWSTFLLLVRTLVPKIELVKIRTIFRVMDKDRTGVISLMSFMQLTDVLALDVTRKAGTRAEMHENDQRHVLDKLTNKYLWIDKTRGQMVEITQWIWWNFVWDCLVPIINILALLLLPYFPFAMGVIEYICFYFFLFKLFFHAFGSGIRALTKNSWMQFDMVVLALTGLGLLCTRDVISSEGATRGWVKLLAVVRFVGFARAMPLLNFIFTQVVTRRGHNKNNNWLSEATTTSAVLRLVPIFFQMCFALVAVTFYMFAVIGMEYFAEEDSYVVTKPGDAPTRCNVAAFYTNDPGFRFCDFGSSMLSLFQILVTNNWPDLMYGAEKKYGVGSAFYFIVFFCIVVIVMLNLLIAMFLDIFVLNIDPSSVKTLDMLLDERGGHYNYKDQDLDDVPADFEEFEDARVISTYGGDENGVVNFTQREARTINIAPGPQNAATLQRRLLQIYHRDMAALEHRKLYTGTKHRTKMGQTPGQQRPNLSIFGAGRASKGDGRQSSSANLNTSPPPLVTRPSFVRLTSVRALTRGASQSLSTTTPTNLASSASATTTNTTTMTITAPSSNSNLGKGAHLLDLPASNSNHSSSGGYLGLHPNSNQHGFSIGNASSSSSYNGGSGSSVRKVWTLEELGGGMDDPFFDPIASGEDIAATILLHSQGSDVKKLRALKEAVRLLEEGLKTHVQDYETEERAQVERQEKEKEARERERKLQEEEKLKKEEEKREADRQESIRQKQKQLQQEKEKQERDNLEKEQAKQEKDRQEREKERQEREKERQEREKERQEREKQEREIEMERSRIKQQEQIELEARKAREDLAEKERLEKEAQAQKLALEEYELDG